MNIVFLCKGSLGDVLPVFSIAQRLRETQPDISCCFVTHLSHLEHFKRHADRYSIKMIPLDIPIKRKKIQLKHQECESDDRVKEMHLSKEACKEADKLVFNLFACEGWYISQLMSIPCVAVSPFILTRSPPVTFEKQLQEAYLELYTKLKSAKEGEVSYNEIEHWMWHLYLDDFGQFCDDIQIPVCPYIDTPFNCPLPPPTPLLYGVSPVIVERQPYWPKSVVLCGYWFSDAVDASYAQTSIDTIPIHCPFSSKSSQSSSYHTITLQEFINDCNTLPVYVGFGSMEEIKCFDEMDCLRLLQVINKSVLEMSKKVLLQTTLSSPLFAAWQVLCVQAQTDSVIIHCLTTFIPHSYLFSQMCTAVHHGGSGTVGVAVKLGLPQIICPILFDQLYWGEKMEWLGLGICLGHPKSLNDANLSQALKQVLSNNILEKAKIYSKIVKQENGVKKAVNELFKHLKINT